MNPEIYQDGPCQVCRLTGVFDGQVGVLLQKAVKDALNAGGNGRLVLECSGVDWADAAGCRQLVQLNSVMSERGGLVLAAVSAPLMQVFEEQGCDHLFEMAVSLPAATHSAGPTIIPSAGMPPAAPSLPTGPPPASNWGSSAIPGHSGLPAAAPNWESPPAAPGGWDPVVDPPVSSIPANSMAADLKPPAMSSDWGAGWENVKPTGASKKSKKPKVQGEGFPWKPVLYAGVPMLSVVVGYLLFLHFRSPVISVTETSVSRQYRQQVDVTITVENGVLSKKSRRALEEIAGFEAVNNPENEPEEEDGSTVKYVVSGQLLGPPAKTKIELIAERGSRTSEIRTLEIERLPESFNFVAENFNLEADRQIDTTTEDLVQNYLIAQNVFSVKAQDPATLPPGVIIDKIREDEKSGGNSWGLRGVPEKEGAYEVNLVFDAPDIKKEAKERGIKIKVNPSKSKAAEPKKEPEKVKPLDKMQEDNPGTDSGRGIVSGQGIAISPTKNISSDGEAESNAAEIDPELRGFLLNRVRKMSFPDYLKRSMEKSIDQLQVGVKLNTVVFDTGSSVFRPARINDLEQALADHSELFQKYRDKLEFIIIGYASLPGTTPKNKALSSQRAEAVAKTLRGRFEDAVSLVIGYGATDIVGASDAKNQVVEVYVGVPPKEDKARQVLDDLRSHISQSYSRQ